MKIQLKLLVTSLALSLMAAGNAYAFLPAVQTQPLLNALTIPKFVDPLPVAGDISVVNATSIPGLAGQPSTPAYNIHIREFQSQILPTGFCGPSWTWGYLTDDDVGTGGVRPSYLGPVVIAERGVTTNPTYLNELPLSGSIVQANLPVDKTLDWANPNPADVCFDDPNHPVDADYTNVTCGMLPSYTGPMPTASHLHGGEVAPAFDGGPDAWITPVGTPGGQKQGIGYPGDTYTYPNNQQESTIWFHDHALGLTRLNVYAGLAGVYPIIDTDLANAPQVVLPDLAYDIPLIIQDRSFFVTQDGDCEIFYNLGSNPQPNPSVHPFWIPEFIGDTILVNGKTWPYLEVQKRQYRFRFVNGSNARFYDLSLGGGLQFLVIATDDGYLQNAVKTGNLIIGPGERYEVIVDFNEVKGQKNQPYPIVTMTNIARTPFPGGGAVVPGLTDTVMQFWVKGASDVDNIPKINAGDAIRSTPYHDIKMEHATFGGPTGVITRQLTLNEVIGAGGPLELVVNNSKFNLAANLPGDIATPEGRETELPAVGDTEIWEIINITADAHPMHTHLVSFQIIDRTPFRAAPWINQYDALLLSNGVLPGEGPPNQYNVINADGAIGGNPAVNPFLKLKDRRLPLPYEMGWKDTVITYPGEVTRIAVRWATTDTALNGAGPGSNTYVIPYDPPPIGDPNPGFDPTIDEGGVGYVWHCHIIDHEDNEMMRNYLVRDARQTVCTVPDDPASCAIP